MRMLAAYLFGIPFAIGVALYAGGAVTELMGRFGDLIPQLNP